MTKQYPLKYSDEFPRYQNLWRLICTVKVRQAQGDESVFSFKEMLKKKMTINVSIFFSDKTDIVINGH